MSSRWGFGGASVEPLCYGLRPKQPVSCSKDAIAETLAPRFGDLETRDPRPRLVGALVMAAIRLALDDWVASKGSLHLPDLINRNLGSVSIEPPRSPEPARGKVKS
jgi:hypothetical protein